MKTRKSLSVGGAVMVAVFVLGLGIANANIIPTQTTVVPSGSVLGGFTWTYDAALSFDQNAVAGPVSAVNPVSNSQLITGSFFTIYDFAGLVPHSETAPTGWTPTEQLVGFTPSNVSPVDDPSILNITWTYTSGADILGTSGGLGGKELGNFTANSIYNLTTPVSYASRGVANSGPQVGSIADNVGNTQGPRPVPEPGTLLLLGFGLVGVAGLRRKFKK